MYCWSFILWIIEIRQKNTDWKVDYIRKPIFNAHMFDTE